MEVARSKVIATQRQKKSAETEPGKWKPKFKTKKLKNSVHQDKLKKSLGRNWTQGVTEVKYKNSIQQ